jgi:Bacterial Ig domain/Right handed beta helix region
MKKHSTTGKVLLGTTLTAALLFSGCGSSENFVFTNTNNNVAAPVAAPDAFNALGNATVNQAAAGVLANDTVNGGTISGFDAVGSQGGTIVLDADGSFTYTPIFGYVGPETFTYTLSNSGGDSTATVTMTSTGSGFFVDNSVAPGGNGSQASPFDTLDAALTASEAGDTIFVARGNGTSTGLAGAKTLKPGVDLIGEGAGLVLAQTIEPVGQPPLLTGPITCGGTNTVSGFTIDGSGSEGIIINNAGNVTITQNTISNPTNEHILCTDVTGTVTISNNTLSDPPNTSIDFITSNNTNTNGTISVTNNIFQNDADQNVDSLYEADANGTSVMSLIFSGNDAIGLTSDDFSNGFYLNTANTSQVTVTVDDNDFTNFEFEPIGIHSDDDGVKLGGSITNNRITDVSDDDGIHADINNDTVTISGNVVTNVNEKGLRLDVAALGGTFIVTNNNVSGAVENGIEFDDDEDGEVKLAIRDNMLTDSGSGVAIYVYWDGNVGDVCCDITGNTVNDDVTFEDDTNNGEINVEQLGVNPFTNFSTVLNTLNGGASVSTSGDVNSVADGFCAIP